MREWVLDRADQGKDIASLIESYQEVHESYAEIRKRLNPGNHVVEPIRKVKYKITQPNHVECPLKPMNYISQKMKKELDLKILLKKGKKIITISDPKNDFKMSRSGS